MQLFFLGTAGSYPVPGRGTTGLYLPDYGIVIDPGTQIGALRQVHGDGPLDVLMSHWHIDHSAGLFFLAARPFAGREGLGEPSIQVWGPPPVDEFRALAGGDSPLFPIPLPFPVQLAQAELRIRGVRVERRLVEHQGPVYAYRLTLPGGESLAVVTDTTAPGDYIDFIRGVDVLVHECTFRNSRDELAGVTGHSHAAAVGRLAADAGVGRLLLTHLSPAENEEALLAEVRAEFPAAEIPVELQEWTGAASPVDPRIAIFPGSFDPLTVSHLDIIDSCRQMFNRVHVVVAVNPAKDRSALFTPEERVELIRRCVPGEVRVVAWAGLTVEYARQVRAGRIVRGLGRAEDYTVEVRLWKANAMLGPEIGTVWVPPRTEHLDVSSTLIKEASVFGGWDGVKRLAPEPIRADVGERLSRLRAETWHQSDGE